MKRLITILLSIALLVMAAGCAGGNTEPTKRETTPTKQDTTEATVPAKVTVYLLDKVTTDYGDYTVYFYDENYNVDYCEQLNQSNKVFCTAYFEEKDINGMAGELREVWDSGTQYICALTWSQDGKLLKKAEDLAKTELEFEYDGAGKLVEQREYWEDAPNEITTIGYSYKAVEVDADRAPCILAQQKYLVSE